MSVCVWDFTLKAEGTGVDAIKALLKEHCKKWCFQLEEGESGYLHYQGRLSLKMKKRLPELKGVFAGSDMESVHLSPTSAANRDNQFYVSKPGRKEGPWKDTDIVVYIPLAIRNLVLRPWQQSVIASIATDNDRTINVIADQAGGMGKSTLVRYVACNSIGRCIPATIAKADDLMQWVMCFPKAALYIADIPRAVNQMNMKELYIALESVKNGYAYDKRYAAREEYFEPPCIWVFCNIKPDVAYLSADKWKFWKVVDNVLLPETTSG